MGYAHGISEPKLNSSGFRFLRFNEGHSPLDWVKALVICRAAWLEAMRVYKAHYRFLFHLNETP